MRFSEGGISMVEAGKGMAFGGSHPVNGIGKAVVSQESCATRV